MGKRPMFERWVDGVLVFLRGRSRPLDPDLSLFSVSACGWHMKVVLLVQKKAIPLHFQLVSIPCLGHVPIERIDGNNGACKESHLSIDTVRS